MSYTKTEWNDNSAPAINAANLNKMETGIEAAHAGMTAAGTTVDATGFSGLLSSSDDDVQTALETIAEPSWDDLMFPATALNPPGGASDPDWDTANGWLLFDAASTETIFAMAQLPHHRILNTNLRPHVHWFKTTSASGDVAWRCRYKIFKIGEVGDSDWTDMGVVSTPAVSDNDVALTHAITSFGDIDTTGMELSDCIMFEISRVGGDASDSYGADAALLQFDVHYQTKLRGSTNEFSN